MLSREIMYMEGWTLEAQLTVSHHITLMTDRDPVSETLDFGPALRRLVAEERLSDCVSR